MVITVQLKQDYFNSGPGLIPNKSECKDKIEKALKELPMSHGDTITIFLSKGKFGLTDEFTFVLYKKSFAIYESIHHICYEFILGDSLPGLECFSWTDGVHYKKLRADNNAEERAMFEV